MLAVMGLGMLAAIGLLQVGILSIANRPLRFIIFFIVPPVAAVFFTKPVLPDCCAFYMTTEPLFPNFPISPMEWAGWWFLYQVSLLSALVISRRPGSILIWTTMIAIGVCLFVEQLGSSVGFWHWHIIDPGQPGFSDPAFDKMPGPIPFPVGHAIFGWVALRALPLSMIVLTAAAIINKLKPRYAALGVIVCLLYLPALVGLAPFSFPFCIIGALTYGYLLGNKWGRELGWQSFRPRRTWPIAAAVGICCTICTVLILIGGEPIGLLMGLPLYFAFGMMLKNILADQNRASEPTPETIGTDA